MKNMSNCPKHGMYPSRFDSCPCCNPAAKSAPAIHLTPQEMISRMSDTDVKYIFHSFHWEQGNAEIRQMCLIEYDRRFGLENWPAHISKEVA